MKVEDLVNSLPPVSEVVARAPEFKARAKAAYDPTIKLVDWFVSQGLSPREACDICLYAVGYIAKIKGHEIDLTDYLGMFAAGKTDALVDAAAFERSVP